MLLQWQSEIAFGIHVSVLIQTIALSKSFSGSRSVKIIVRTVQFAVLLVIHLAVPEHRTNTPQIYININGITSQVTTVYFL